MKLNSLLDAGSRRARSSQIQAAAPPPLALQSPAPWWSSAIPRPTFWTSSSKTTSCQTQSSARRSNKPSTPSALSWRRGVSNVPLTQFGCPKLWRWVQNCLVGEKGGWWASVCIGTDREQKAEVSGAGAFWFIHGRTIITFVKIASGVRASVCKFLTNSLEKCINHLGHDCYRDKQSESWQHLQFTNLDQAGILLFLLSHKLVKSICFKSR